MKKAPDYLPMLCEVLNGFEPMIRELQSHALPLGYSTLGIRLSPPKLSKVGGALISECSDHDAIK